MRIHNVLAITGLSEKELKGLVSHVRSLSKGK
jgi:hypothetical protein